MDSAYCAHSEGDFMTRNEFEEDVISISVDPESKLVAIPGANYRMGQTPVTQRLYEKVMGENPSYFQHSNDNLDAEQRDALECNTANNPVKNVSWFDAVYFCSQRYLFANTPLRQAQGAAIFRQAKERQFFCYTEASSLSLLQRYVFGNKPLRQAQGATVFFAMSKNYKFFPILSHNESHTC